MSRVLDSEAGRSSLDLYHVPLNAEETEEFHRRKSVLLKMVELENRLRNQHENVFAAVYLDHHDNGTLKIAVAAKNDAVRSAAAAAGVERFEVTMVSRTAVELEGDFEELNARLLADRPDHIIGWAVDEVGNTIAVLTPDAEFVDDAERYLSTLGAPPYVEVRVREVRQAGQVWGGDPLSTCSAGAQVYADTIYGRLYYTLTASHCPNGLSHRVPVNDNHPLPFIVERGLSIYGVSHADVQIHYAGDNAGVIYDYATNGSDGVVVESELFGIGDMLGDWVCKAGKTTGNTCGTLLIRNQTITGNIDGVVYVRQRLSTIPSSAGDSGGVVYAPTIYGAVVAGGVWGSGYYSHIEYMHRALAHEGAPFVVRKVYE